MQIYFEDSGKFVVSIAQISHAVKFAEDLSPDERDFFGFVDFHALESFDEYSSVQVQLAIDAFQHLFDLLSTHSAIPSVQLEVWMPGASASQIGTGSVSGMVKQKPVVVGITGGIANLKSIDHNSETRELSIGERFQFDNGSHLVVCSHDVRTDLMSSISDALLCLEHQDPLSTLRVEYEM